MPTTPYMNLTLPTPTVSPGPAYATTLNNAFTGVDSHNHTPGYGVPIPTAGININADVNFGTTNAYGLRTSRYVSGSVLATAADINCVFVSAGNLYYNNNLGQHVQITAGSGINISGTTGIGGDYASSGASVFYTLATLLYSFTNPAGTFSALKSGAHTLVNAGGFGPTITSPLALASNYTLTLFNGNPAAIKIVTLDASGSLGAAYDFDSSTIEVVANVIQVKNLGITTAKLAASAVTTAKIADGAVTNIKRAALGQQISSSSGNFVTTSATPVLVTNLSVSITTVGRPVLLMLITTNVGTGGYIEVSGNSSNSQGRFIFTRDGSNLSIQELYVRASGATATLNRIPCSSFSFMDVMAAGTYAYTCSVYLVAGDQVVVNDVKLVAYEL